MHRKSRITLKIITLGTLFTAAMNSAIAATLTVATNSNSCPNANFTTIATAVNTAAPGDEIEICPGVYPEQIVITKSLTLRGVESNGFNQALLQPTLTSLQGIPFQAVITIMNTKNVTIHNLMIDASNNTISGCAVGLSGVHFLNASGSVEHSAIIGAKLQNPQSCKTLTPGNGSGIQVDSDNTAPGPFRVLLKQNVIHDFSRNGILAVGSGVTAEVEGNDIAGAGPSLGVFQFGVFISTGAVGLVTNNKISQGLCNGLSPTNCIAVRSEGVVLRAVGDGTIVDGNSITNVQSGIFVNGGNNARITNNWIRNVEALSGINIQGTASKSFTNSLIEGNHISNVGPISAASADGQGCGINEYTGTNVSGNILQDNVVSDAYCGIAHVTADFVGEGSYFNTLYTTFNSDLYPTAYPPATLP
jgi:nitrous oxidase accessory protein NosD